MVDNFIQSKQRLPFYTCEPPQKIGHGAIAFLAPWFVSFEDPSSVDYGALDNWRREGQDFYALANDEELAAFHVLYSEWWVCQASEMGREFAAREISRARDAGKKILIWCVDDRTDKIDWPDNVVCFRHAINKSSKHPREFAPPLFHRDHLADNSLELIQQEVGSLPRLGFCGYAPPLGTRSDIQRLKDAIKYYLYVFGFPTGDRTAHAVRARAIVLALQSELLDCNFIIRSKFAFNQWGVLQPGGPDEARSQRFQYINNIYDSDYVLCTRGIANCSIRLYETVCLGRIPVLVDTDCALPWDSVLPWDDLLVRLPERDLPSIGQAISNSFQSMSRIELDDLHARLRQTWLEWLSPEGYFRNIWRFL